MGYTHYWEKAAQITDEQWNEFKEFVSKAIGTVNNKEVENSAGGDHYPSLVIIKGGDGGGQPEISDELICFNGNGLEGHDHESFYIPRSGSSGFNFCKTARKPYDPVVVACLVAAERIGIIDEWSSDGEDSEHESGKELYDCIAAGQGLPFEARVTVDLCEIIGNDLEGFLNILAEDAGKPLLMDIQYKIVGYKDNSVIFEVTGDTSMCDEAAEESTTA